MVNFVRLILIPQLGSSVAGFFGRFLGSEGTAIMTTPEFLLPLFVLVLILTIIYRILLSKKKKEFSSIIPNLYFSFLFMLSLSLLHFRKDCSFFRSDNSLIHFDFECFLFWIEFECPFRRRIRGNKSSSLGVFLPPRVLVWFYFSWESCLKLRKYRKRLFPPFVTIFVPIYFHVHSRKPIHW